MQARAGFVFVHPYDADEPGAGWHGEAQDPFWLRTSDIVGIKPTHSGGVPASVLMRHATVPLTVHESADDVLFAIAQAEGHLDPRLEHAQTAED